jgi:quercetin dioxygenase-like cupin family protein
MSNDLKQIAERIKEIREINGISLETLAKEFSVQLETFRKYESGESDIPVGILSQISHRFKVDLTTIITGEEPKLRIYSVTKKGSAPTTERRKEYRYQDLGFNFVNKKAEAFLVSVDPKDEKEPMNFNSHPGQEFNYILEGKLKIVLNGHEIILEEGDTIFFDSGYKHAMKAVNGKPAKFLALIF